MLVVGLVVIDVLLLLLTDQVELVVEEMVEDVERLEELVLTILVEVVEELV